MPCRSDDPECSVPSVPDWMLCEALVILDKAGLVDECSDQLREWWYSHQKKEEGRVRAEAAAKLSDRERIALKIDARGNFIGTRVIGGKKR